jgi:hypothetical protein
LRPASGDLADDSGVELATALAITPGFEPGRPALARDGDHVRIAWIERQESPGTSSTHVRLTTLAPNGTLANEPIEILPGNAPQSRVTLHAEGGVTALSWAEQGDDPSLASRIVVHRRNQNGMWLRAEIPSPAFNDYGPPGLIRRAKPESLLAVWSASSMNDGRAVTYAARLDCVTPESATYDAFWGPPMALARVHVIKRDAKRDLCFHIGLVFPDSSSQYPVTMPDKWSIEDFSVRLGASSCTPQPGSVQANAATGTIDWPASNTGQPPCALDLALSASFPESEPWVPASETFTAKGVSVKGGACGD